ncbi:MAG: 50S ribosomal protein L32e [archaeon GB-1867-097]|nr:50S ribosomal protein L32e [Candidatus Verstraetearchaeota archaeon]MCS7373531.1 50S ribosomal protein L32e [Candidatus Culexmicrobium thermophilum]MCS7384674.1 50S ribosomal protein L32e [Candidatus Culexmicrobium thermophilum]RLE56994.1 MAG: 50S ribosomal protein L32e [Candidatus Verstraetearchaeota archaeon]HDO20152.1 50S ribosomal protein L32e [Candidatus Bathyarchaeota archaeon]
MEREKIKELKKNRKKYRFLRPWHYKLKRLGTAWRRPKGLDDKHRLKLKGYPPQVEVGYRSPKKIRHHHPSGYLEKIVHNLKELEEVDAEKFAVRIAHTVGRRKRIEIMKKAAELGIKILNPEEILTEIEG